jgi:hypothetical protein
MCTVAGAHLLRSRFVGEKKAQQLQSHVDSHQKQLIYQNELILAVSILGLR